MISLSLYFFLSGFLDLDDELDVGLFTDGVLFVVGGLVDVDWGVLVGDDMGFFVGEVLVNEDVGILVGEGGGVFIG